METGFLVIEMEKQNLSGHLMMSDSDLNFPLSGKSRKRKSGLMILDRLNHQDHPIPRIRPSIIQ